MIGKYCFDINWLNEINNKVDGQNMLKIINTFMELLDINEETNYFKVFSNINNEYQNLFELKHSSIIFEMLGYFLDNSDKKFKLECDINYDFKQRFLAVKDTILEKINKIDDSFGQNLCNTRARESEYYFKKCPKASRTFRERISFPSVLGTKSKLLLSIEEQSNQFNQYNDKNLIAYAKEITPVHMLSNNAIKKMRLLQKQNNSKTNDIYDFREIFLYELMNWFNTKFFEWVDIIPCKVCGSSDKTQLKQYSYIENDIQCEVNFCCNTETKFYRYIDIEKLLQTRKGRCGEFASCFAFLCFAFKYDVRLVCPQFDHVWTEVYLDSKKCWIHLDPSENVFNSPLMYEHGWNRKIDYVIAYSIDDIQDVTWRYTNSHISILQRRYLCSEKELINTIFKIRNEKLYKKCSAARIKYLKFRNCMELVSFFEERQATENERKGRSSGSDLWKLERGEAVLLKKCFVFALTNLDKIYKQFNLRYSCSKDIYEKYIIIDGVEKKYWECNGWQNCVESMQDIFRKVEHDWKMVYLAREDGAEVGKITWKFDFEKMIISKFSCKLNKQIYENGYIDFNIKNTINGLNTIEGYSGFEIAINLPDRDKNNKSISWQHAQLFRQPDNSNEFPFDLKISFY